MDNETTQIHVKTFIIKWVSLTSQFIIKRNDERLSLFYAIRTAP